tara:strand:- start:750 stop:1184 length:435 start_codon:yes stop_codon:yes gene_type:complete
MKKKFNKRRKLDRLAENYFKRKPYRTTLADCELWFDILNNIIFKRSLPAFDSITIRRMRSAVGQVIITDKEKNVECHLEMNTSMKNFQTFLEVLGHEMVHLWQYTKLSDSTCNHNIEFYKWKRVFGQNGLRLTLTIDNEPTRID